MVDIKIKVAGKAVGDVDIETETKASVKDDQVIVELGKILYAVESMGFSFVTDDVYRQAIKALDNVSSNSRYSRIYASETLEVSVRKTA